MRPLRNFRANQCCHLISRIANRAFFLNDEEKTRFVERLWRVAAFSCVEVLAYCFMSNHFHILVYVPTPRKLSDRELLSRIRAFYSGTALAEVEKEWKLLEKVGGAKGKERFRKRYLRRMWSASEFMKTLKQDATMSYNGRRVHSGTIWESRFRARTCEPEEKAELMNSDPLTPSNPFAVTTPVAETATVRGFAIASKSGWVQLLYLLEQALRMWYYILSRWIMTADDTKYSVLLRTLKANILSGKYDLWKPFPSERALISRFKLSRNTVQHVLHELIAEGLLTSRRGAGYFVTKAAVSRQIGILIPRKGYSEFFQLVIGEISRLAQQNGYSLLFGEMPTRGPEGRARATIRLAKDMVKQGVAGVIFQPNEGIGDAETINGTVASIFKNAGVALVLCDYDMVTPPARSEFDVVGSNNIEAGMRLAEHLIASGARHILFVLPPNAATSHVNRCRGAIALATSLDGKCRCEALEASPDDVNAFRKRFRRNRPDAIIGCNDKCAAELLRTLGKLNVRVPDDMLLAGFDDISIAALTIPSLTTIHQPCAKIARAAFGRLLARMRNPELDPMKITLDAPLVVRESTTRANEKKARK